MTATIIVSCDGTWHEGQMPCRSFLPTREADQDMARVYSLNHGWTTNMQADLDLCPACTSRTVTP